MAPGWNVVDSQLGPETTADAHRGRCRQLSHVPAYHGNSFATGNALME